VTNAYVTVHNL